MHLADAHYPLSPLNMPPTILDHAEGMLVHSARKRVCIYGAGRGREEAPLDDISWEVWALNLVPPMAADNTLRCDRWFDIHQRTAQTPDDMRWIATCPVPIYVPQDLLRTGPNCVRYPQRILNKYASAPFACTFAYQIALALEEKFEEIGLYGVELAYGTARERTVEWASTSWWIGYATAKGVKFTTPEKSRLGIHPKLYGFDYDAEIADVDEYIKASYMLPLYGKSQGG